MQAHPFPQTVSSEAEIVIVGGGLVGASLAIALDLMGRRAVLVEATAPRPDTQPSHDDRNLALSRTTVNGLRRLGVWDYAADSAEPIREVHVTRAGCFGSLRIEAARAGVDALGWTLPARALGRALLSRLQDCRHLQRQAPARLVAAAQVQGGWKLEVETSDGPRQWLSPLLVGADGTESMVRARLGIGALRHDYAQTLFVATIATERPHQGRAWERFRGDGPVAVLPLPDGRCGVVLTVPTEEASALAALDDAGFVQRIQRDFGWWLGRLGQPGRRHAYPIASCAAARLVGERAVLVGNAAQTVHPVGAQGFNLGLRDALTLAEMVAGAADPGAEGLLHAYALRREADRSATMQASDRLIRLVCEAPAWTGPLHSLGLLLIDRLDGLHGRVARQGMGFRPNLPLTQMELRG
ncbi:2-octaprenyl-6-methoxyphenyl hydroxylase [Frateuria aurantia]